MKIWKIIENIWYLKRNEYRKMNLYTNLKERPSFEQYLNLSNPQLQQTIYKKKMGLGIRLTLHFIECEDIEKVP